MKRITLCLTILLAIIMIPGVILAAVETAKPTTQEQFITAIEDGVPIEISQDITIKLEKDIIITEKVTIGLSSGTNKIVTLDLNGHTIKLNGSNAQFFVQKKGTLVIEDSVGNGLITNAEATACSQYPIQVVGKCEINGGTLENEYEKCGCIVYIQRDATCTLNGGTIRNLRTNGGDVVKLSVATFIMNGGKIENKAKGDGLTPSAINGHKVIMTGGTIEAAATAITATGKSVEITGGTINAGLFAIFARYAIINPAEGKEVNISAERAAVIAYSKPASGDGNIIYGGNFSNCPVLETEKYQASDPTNMKVYGGEFTHEVPAEFLAPGYVVNKDGDKYKVELNTPNFVDDDLKADDEVEMGVVPEVQEKLEEIFEKEIEENEKIQEALLEGKKVDIHIQMQKVEENDVKDEIEAIKEKSKDKKFVDIYDITLVIKADGTQIDTISETSNKLKFKVLIPEDLLKDNRTFFMYRYHEEGEVKVEEITGQIDDENYFVFETDRFSTYVLAYEDKEEQQEDNTGNEGTTTPPIGEGETGQNPEDNTGNEGTTPPTIGEGEAEQEPEDNTGNEGTITPPTTDEGETEQNPEDNTSNEEILTPPTGKGEAEQEPEEKPTIPDVPKTGDTVMRYVIIALVSIVGIAIITKSKK